MKRKGPTQVINRPNPLPEAVLNEIENAEGWASVVHILCDSFKLPGQCVIFMPQTEF